MKSRNLRKIMYSKKPRCKGKSPVWRTNCASKRISTTRPRRSCTNSTPSSHKWPKIAATASRSSRRSWRTPWNSCARSGSRRPPWRASSCRRKTTSTSCAPPSSSTRSTSNSEGLKMTSLSNNKNTKEPNSRVNSRRVHPDRLLSITRISRSNKPRTGPLMRATLTCLTHRVQALFSEIKDRLVLKGTIWEKVIKTMVINPKRDRGTTVTINICWSHLRKRPCALWFRTSMSLLRWKQRELTVK